LLADDHIKDADKRRRYLQALSAESTRLSMLIENVLDLRRMERGERVHEPRVEDLAALVQGTVELFAPLLERSGNKVRYQGLEPGMEVLVDRDDLRQAFLNLLDNARKYGGESDIHVGLERRGSQAILRLQDGGEGIDPAERESIFERFARGQKHQHGGIPGVGIGLNLARAILRRQGGDLVACDPPSGQTGACFELRLPLYLSDPPQAGVR
jgi:signal transduction histidine kinase